MAYELKLPIGSKIHDAFHVSCLNMVIGQNIIVSYTLTPLDYEGQQVFSFQKKYLKQWKEG